MKIEVVPYNPEWKYKFEDEKQILLEKLSTFVEAIHHIGSTSVDGLAAKPVIDILLEVSSLEDLDNASHLFEELGYEVMGEFGIKDRRYYRKNSLIRTYQIHAFLSHSFDARRHLAFRDYLKQHPNVKNQYGQLKHQLASTCDDTNAYSKGKDAFVKYYEKQALGWKYNE